LILKDTLLSRDPDSGREQATISWECDFDLPPQTVPGDVKNKTVFIPWSALNPTYRGKLKKDAKPIDLKKVKRFSIMMRRWVLLEQLKLSFTSADHSSASLAPRKANSASLSGRSKPSRTHRRLPMLRSFLTPANLRTQKSHCLVVSGVICQPFCWLLI
jgi:hypothetical protein